MPKSLVARLVLLVCAALGLILLGFVAVTLLRTPGEQVAAGNGAVPIGGPFVLTDQFGKRRSDADFAGQLKLIYFGFTYCPDVCPTELQAMTAALDALGPAADKVTPIFITVDPARDTVDQMRAYAEHFHPRLVALTGTESEIAAVAKAYRIYYARVEDGSTGDYTMDHSSIVYLMGPDGRFLTHFAGGTSAEAMAETIRQYL